MMIGDGTDTRGLLWAYELVKSTWREHPSRMLYGSIYTTLRAVPDGGGIWVPINEKLLVPLLTQLARDGLLPTAVALTLMVFNGMSVVYMGEKLRWHRAATFAIALAFTVIPYTRARAAVHIALVGYYWLPLAIGATAGIADIWRDGKAVSQRRAYLEYALVLLLAVTVAHYYLILLAILLPWFVYFFSQRSASFRFRRWLFAALCAAPAIAITAFQFSHPLPPDVPIPASGIPVSDKVLAHRMVRAYGVEPWNYVTGDIKFGPYDALYPRQLVNEVVYTPDQSRNPHERSNGIRWLILIPLLVAGAIYPFRKPRVAPSRQTQAWLVLAAGAWLCALSPEFFPALCEKFTPAMLINRLVPQFRVPSRIGPVFHFALLLLFGDLLSSCFQRRKPIASFLSFTVPLCIVLESAPVSPMLRSELLDVWPQLSRADGSCGAGFSLPFEEANYDIFEETRGTRCALVNPLLSTEAEGLERAFGEDAFQDGLAAETLPAFVECMGLSWIRFGGPLAGGRAANLCHSLGWQMTSAKICVRPEARPPSGARLQACTARSAQ